MKSDIVLRIEKALYEIAVLNGLSEAGKVDCIKVCESFMLPPITYGITNPEEHYITCEKRTTRATL